MCVCVLLVYNIHVFLRCLVWYALYMQCVCALVREGLSLCTAFVIFTTVVSESTSFLSIIDEDLALLDRIDIVYIFYTRLQ